MRPGPNGDQLPGELKSKRYNSVRKPDGNAKKISHLNVGGLFNPF